MSKLASFLIIALLLCFSVTSAARPEPACHDADATLKTTPQHVEGVEAQKVEMEESCQGVVGKEMKECLTRRTLAAHLDYIYTQDNQH